jgi:anti-anti-sigma factor
MTTAGKINVIARARGSTQLLSVSGEIDVATVGVLAGEIREALARNADTVVVDLSGVACFAVDGVRMLINADRRARTRGCRLVVTASGGAARRVLTATNAERWLTIAS